MAMVVDITSNLHRAFEAYAAARRKADETLKFEDAETARKAWKAYVAIGMTSEQKHWLGLDDQATGALARIGQVSRTSQ